MRTSPAIARIRAARRMLNLRRGLSMASRWGATAAAVSAPAACAAILAGWTAPPLAATLAFAAGTAGFLAGFALSVRGRYRDRHAALWLDRGLADDGLFSAALACLERARLGAPGPRDAWLAARADSAVPASAGLRVPARYLTRPLAALGASFLLCAAALAVPPATAGERGASPADRAAGTVPLGSEAGETVEELLAKAAESPSPEDLARSLFPDQPELADLLADALRDGRLADAEKILEKAELARTDLRREEGQGIGAPGAQSLHERLQEAVREQGGSSTGSDETRTERGEEGGSGDQKSAQTGEQDAAPMEAPDGAGAQAPGDGAAAGTGGSGGTGSGTGGQDGNGGDSGIESPGGLSDPSSGDKSKGGGASGSGSGVSRDWGPIDPSATGGDLGIRPLDGGAYFELLLPEDGSGMTDLQRVIASSRSAEEAIARLSLPAEYEEAIRAYFTLLNRDAAAAAGP